MDVLCLCGHFLSNHEEYAGSCNFCLCAEYKPAATEKHDNVVEPS